ncbi:DsbE family thiol:disulfide interchange protein [Allopusillimonas ginsengisoli]|uniref:DsbE family thiol:disulfide interchange protein n=1 Tax=Allopusillimonas ginsengisoli TaxID=453575 RepID=UPI00101ECC47|nr:DsbE family thiol:disulfide interchange protein [Allopusillimonas ginsengisoli]TEA78985.1 DsbE family thiol:disulfide interchange protein [Allopusillimonas ginsengisoli]
MKTRVWLPLAIFFVLIGFLGVGLRLDPRLLPSPLIDKPAPQFTLPSVHVLDRQFSSGSLEGQVWVLNVWASWCVACRQEHDVLMDFAARQAVPVYGLNYKDQRADALRWLNERGDPYQDSLFDLDGRIGVDFGVYGVPETFVIDDLGRIRYKHAGPLTPELVHDVILPLIGSLND